jgi:hypothetical protein
MPFKKRSRRTNGKRRSLQNNGLGMKDDSYTVTLTQTLSITFAMGSASV